MSFAATAADMIEVDPMQGSARYSVLRDQTGPLFQQLNAALDTDVVLPRASVSSLTVWTGSGRLRRRQRWCLWRLGSRRQRRDVCLNPIVILTVTDAAAPLGRSTSRGPRVPA